MSENVLDFIKSCVTERKIFWTYHVNMRFKERSISREQIIDAVSSYEIIEEYQEDKYLPSYLVYAKYKETVLHIHVAVDTQNKNIRIITAYRPTPDKWEKDWKTRRKS